MHISVISSQRPEDRALADASRAAEVRALFRRGPSRLLDVGHSRLAYYRIGRGPDVVFVHGWPLHSATFRGIAPDLAEHFTCHFIDLPGAGRTETTDATPIGLAEHAETLKAALRELELSSFALLAHDSGGAVVRLAAAGDARVKALVLGNTEIPGHHPKVIEFYAALARVPFGFELVRAAMQIEAVRRSSLGFKGCFSDVSSLDGDFHELFVAPLLSSPHVFREQARLIANLDSSLVDDLARVHGRISAPVLLVWGADDPFFPLDKARGMLAQFAGPAELREIPKAKLFAHEDHAREFVAHALPFLRAAFG